MAKPAIKEDESQEPLGPAVVTDLHTRARDISVVAGSPKGWNKWTPLEAFFDKRRKASPSEKLTAEDIVRFNAGQQYTVLWDTAQSSGKDSTQSLNVSRGGGSGLPLSQRQHDAIRALVAVESHLGQRDRIIIRMVCGQGSFPSEAVAMVGTGYAKATTPRFLEALDALADSFEAVRKAPGRFNPAIKK